eukprot:15452280-Alexandrium_andersonii.AAC.1
MFAAAARSLTSRCFAPSLRSLRSFLRLCASLASLAAFLLLACRGCRGCCAGRSVCYAVMFRVWQIRFRTVRTPDLSRARQATASETLNFAELSDVIDGCLQPSISPSSTCAVWSQLRGTVPPSPARTRYEKLFKIGKACKTKDELAAVAKSLPAVEMAVFHGNVGTTDGGCRLLEAPDFGGHFCAAVLMETSILRIFMPGA